MSKWIEDRKFGWKVFERTLGVFSKKDSGYLIKEAVGYMIGNDGLDLRYALEIKEVDGIICNIKGDVISKYEGKLICGVRWDWKEKKISCCIKEERYPNVLKEDVLNKLREFVSEEIYNRIAFVDIKQFPNEIIELLFKDLYSEVV
ncbi:MAG: hypothetical protein QXI58_08165 [Candidatus Micrarchaeia archaeon]